MKKSTNNQKVLELLDSKEAYESAIEALRMELAEAKQAGEFLLSNYRLVQSEQESRLQLLIRLQEALPVESGVGSASTLSVAIDFVIEYIRQCLGALVILEKLDWQKVPGGDTFHDIIVSTLHAAEH